MRNTECIVLNDQALCLISPSSLTPTAEPGNDPLLQPCKVIEQLFPFLFLKKKKRLGKKPSNTYFQLLIKSFIWLNMNMVFLNTKSTLVFQHLLSGSLHKSKTIFDSVGFHIQLLKWQLTSPCPS